MKAKAVTAAARRRKLTANDRNREASFAREEKLHWLVAELGHALEDVTNELEKMFMEDWKAGWNEKGNITHQRVRRAYRALKSAGMRK